MRLTSYEFTFISFLHFKSLMNEVLHIIRVYYVSQVLRYYSSTSSSSVQNNLLQVLDKIQYSSHLSLPCICHGGTSETHISGQTVELHIPQMASTAIHYKQDYSIIQCNCARELIQVLFEYMAAKIYVATYNTYRLAELK